MSNMVSRRALLPALLIFVGATSACRDGAVAPAGPSAGTSAPRLALTTSQLGSGLATVSVATIKVLPKRDASFNFGNGLVNFPARSICAPSSTYGTSTWDSPCTAVDTAVTITAYSWTDSQGHPTVMFEPSLRFSPRTTVTLTLFDKTASPANVPPILWCDDRTFTCTDESIVDASVATSYVVSGGVGYLYRRIKHFSGYQVQLRMSEDSTSMDGGLTDSSF